MPKENKKNTFRLSLLFALIVFVIMLVAMFLVIGGSVVLEKMHIISEDPENRVPLFYFALVSMLVGTVIAFLFSNKPLKPIREIMDAADRIASGDYSARVDIKGIDEFQILGDKFNHMAEELGSVEMLRSDFIGNFSHEFKTPITSIRGFARALKWEDLSDEQRNEYLDIIIDESERLSDLSNNVLYMSKVEKQSILSDTSEFNITEQIRLVIALLASKMDQKHLNVSMDAEEYYIRANEEMLKQVWINLLDNAIKFSPEKGVIDIKLEKIEDVLSVKIKNSGETIPKEIQKHIFDKFYQGDVSHSTIGNGLGLAIVKRIVDLHGDTIEVCSDEGATTFSLSIKDIARV